MIRRLADWWLRRALRREVMEHFDAAQALHIQAKADALTLFALQQIVRGIHEQRANPPEFEVVPFSGRPMEIKDFPPAGPERKAFLKKWRKKESRIKRGVRAASFPKGNVHVIRP